jgi:hypothetical protein
MTTALAAFTGFPNEWDPTQTADTLSEWNSLTHVMGQAPTMMLTYIDLTHPLSEWVSADTAWEISSFALGPWLPGEVAPIIGIPLALQGDNADTDFKAIISGQWDQTLHGVFQAWANAGYKSIDIRPGHEMNGNWYPWSVTSQNVADYVAAFQHVANLAHSFVGLSIKVVWSPNAVTYTTLPVSSYYPGNASVDVIGIDEYGPPLGTDALPSAVSTGPADYTLGTALAMAKADDKPFALAETSAMDTAFPASEAAAVVAAGVPVAYVALWDYNDPSAQNFDFSSSPTIAAAWKQAFATISSSSSQNQTPKTISIQAPGTVQEASRGAGVNVTETITTSGLSGNVYEEVLTSAGAVETGYTAVALSNGVASASIHLAKSGDTIRVVDNTTSPDVIATSSPVTITDRPISVSSPGTVQEASPGAGVTVPLTVTTNNLSGDITMKF